MSDSSDHEPNLGDVSTVDQLPHNLDLVVGGVPCQAWSIAGKTLGFDDPRGRLWFDVCRHFVATVVLSNCEPSTYKQQFLAKY